ncbi:MAG: polysaccharide pyruvyl transferase family protein [Elainellaceae cyanobacterium]
MSHILFTQIQTKLRRAHQLLFSDRQAKRFYHWKDYFVQKPIAGYIGFLGHHNLGDDVLYQAYKLLFNEYQLLTYDGAIDPVYNSPFNRHPLELMLYRSLIKTNPFYDLIFLGGGTLINRRSYLSQFQHALQSKQPCVVFGTGVCDPEFWQMHGPKENYVDLIKEWVQALQKAKIVKVRGPRSAQILEEYGLPQPEFVSDPALAFCSPRPMPFQRTGTIGINIGSHGVLWGNQQDVYQTILQLIPQLIQSGWKIDLLPFHSSDLNWCLKLAQQFCPDHVAIKALFTQVDQAVQQIQNYDLIIGQRLHSVVLACGYGVPFISLNYAPKCDDFIDSIHCQDFSVRTNELDIEELLFLIAKIDQYYDAHCQRLVEVGNYYRRVQYRAVEKIKEWLPSGLRELHKTPKR